ncbi:MAG: carboxypeptidase regulatory-like domain-containing protein [Armatimonadota bacterium]|nr:MAG: carboxypeptidase regulatory-like domain-containing protein [Armatimonadota bacterium]
MKSAVRIAPVVSFIGLLVVIAGAVAPPVGAEGGTWPPEGQLVGGIPYDVVVQDGYAYVAAAGALTVLDVTDPFSSVQLGYCDTPNWAVALDVSGAYAYVADSSAGLRVIDVSDPTLPVEVAVGDTSPGAASDVEVVGDYAYVAAACQGVVIIDITDPENPVRVGNCAFEDANAVRLAIWGDYAYVTAGYGGLRIVDVSDPARPEFVGGIVIQTPEDEEPMYHRAVAARGRYAYVGVDGCSLNVIDVSDPTAPEQAGDWPEPFIESITLSPYGYAYVTMGSGGVVVLDVSDPPWPYEVSWWTTPTPVAWPSAVAVDSGYAYVADEYAGVRVVDVVDPEQPVEVADSDTPDWALGVAAIGDYAYVADGLSGMRIYGIANPLNPVPLSIYDTSGYAQNVTALGNLVFIADGYEGVEVVDVSDPLNPVHVNTVPAGGWAWKVVVQTVGEEENQKLYAYVAADTGLVIIDLTDLEEPAWAGYFYVSGDIVDIAVAQGRAYLACGYGGIQVVNVSNPAAPQAEGTLGTADYAWGVAISGRFTGPYVYVADGHAGLGVIDVSDPFTIFEVARCDTPGYARKVALLGGYVCVADNHAGMRLIDVSDPANPTEAGAVVTPGFATDVAVQPGYMYLQEGFEDLPVGYVYIADDFGGLRVAELPTPKDPVERSYLERPGRARAVAVSGDYVYLADGPPGIRVVDVSDKSNPTHVRFFDLWSGVNSMVVAGDYLYTTDAAGLWVWSLANPANPVFAGAWLSPGDPVDVAVSGQYAYVVDNFPGVRVVDVSNPWDPVGMGYWDTIGWSWGVAAVGTDVYVTDEWSGLRIIDASDPWTPVEVGWCDTPGYARDVAVGGGYAYVADSWMGLRIIDVSDRSAPVEVGHLNTPHYAVDVEYEGGYVYVPDQYGGLRIIAVWNPQAPGEVAYWDTPGTASDVVLGGGYAYLADYGWGLLVFPEMPAQPGAVTGRVRVAGTATYLEGVTVEAYSGDQLRGSATTDSSGAYTITDLLPDAYTVKAYKPGYVGQTQAGVIVPAGGTVEVNCDLPISGILMGQVRERDTTINIPNATVAAYLGGELRAATTTDSRGIYLMLTNLPAGEYVVVASKAGYVTQTKAHIPVTAGATTYVNFALAPRPAPLKGQVKDASTSLPLVGAAIGMYLDGSVVATTVTTAPYGVYEFGTSVPAGTYTVIASMPGYVRQSKSSVTVTESATTYVNFSLPVSGKLKGQVKDYDTGTPIVGATILARSGGVLWAVGTTTAPWGVYEIASDLPAGTYVVGASKAGYLGQTRKDIPVTAGATTYVNFWLQPQ